MQFLNGFIYGSGFTTGALVVVVIMRAIFHIGLRG